MMDQVGQVAVLCLAEFNFNLEVDLKQQLIICLEIILVETQE